MAKGPRRLPEPERDPADSPPDFKHYAIMGSLMAGPPILVLIVLLALSGGRSREVQAGPGVTDPQNLQESQALTRRQIRERQITVQVERLLVRARSLHSRAVRPTKRFYEQEEQKPKMEAFREAERLLRDAQDKLDEAIRADRFRKNETATQDLKQMVDRDLHNILKDKPLFLDD